MIQSNTNLILIFQVIELIAKAGGSNNKFEVVDVSNSEILDFHSWWPLYYHKNSVSEETKTKKRTEKDHFTIQKFHQFRSSSENPGILKTRTYIDGLQESSFQMSQSGIRRPILFPAKKAYAAPIPLSEEKSKDIRKLLVYVPEKFKTFYTDNIV